MTLLSELIQPVTQLVAKMHTSEKERLELQAKLFELQSALSEHLLDYEARLFEAKVKVITSESEGKGWIKNNWRPMTMLTFLALIIADTYGLTEFRVASEAWSLLEVGLSGYVVGRSAEQVIPRFTKFIKRS